jgi:hypothetical protein
MQAARNGIEPAPAFSGLPDQSLADHGLVFSKRYSRPIHDASIWSTFDSPAFCVDRSRRRALSPSRRPSSWSASNHAHRNGVLRDEALLRLTTFVCPRPPTLPAGGRQITDNMGYGKQTAVVTKGGFFSQDHFQFTLMHEVLLHAYGNWWDDPIFANTFFTQNGLWRPGGSTATTNISTWMSTDCTCTPGKPGMTCSANTASW